MRFGQFRASVYLPVNHEVGAERAHRLTENGPVAYLIVEGVGYRVIVRRLAAIVIIELPAEFEIGNGGVRGKKLAAIY